MILGKKYRIAAYAEDAENAAHMFNSFGGMKPPVLLSFPNQLLWTMKETVKQEGKLVFDVFDVDLDMAKKGFGNFTEADEAGRITEWELSNILRDESLFNSTVFHVNGESKTASDLGLQLIK